MAQYKDQYGNIQNEEFGAHLAHAHGGNVVTQGVGIGATGTYGPSGNEHPQQLHEDRHGQQEKLPRDDSSSSSLSEDDGEGDRMKKVGLTEKIMNKIPGVGKKEQQQSHNTSHYTTATTNLTGNEVDSHEDKYFNVLRR